MAEVGSQELRAELSSSMTMNRILLLAICLGLAGSPAALAQRGSDAANPVIEEFKKYIRSPETAVRRDQVERLARVNTAEAVMLLLTKGLTDDDYSVREKAQWALSWMTGEAREFVIAGLGSSKPAIREGVCMAIGAMKIWQSKPPMAQLGTMLQEDRSEIVRAAAAECMGLMGNTRGTPFLIQGLNDRAERVVIASADGLGLLRQAAGAGPLVQLLDHRSWRAQVAALSAMAKIRNKVSIGPIIEYMDVATGRARADAHRALTKITTRTFGMNAATWREWWERVKGDWEVPPPPKKVEVKAIPGGKDGYGRSKPTRYHRITTYSKRIIFVIDISNSMKTPIIVNEGKDTGRRRLATGTAKILLAREELKRTLEGMDSETWFNVIAFETDVRQFKKAPVRASAGNIQGAVRWLLKQEPRGQQGGRRPSSNVDKHGWIVGKTNSYGALAAVYGLKIDFERRGTRAATAPSPGTKRRPKWDTCFFLSDGRPTVGVVTEIEHILQDVKRWNKTCKMVIHCIGMENEQGLAALLSGLSHITGGKVVYLGK